MISGLGTDMVKTSRIREILEKNQHSFISRVFTDSEIIEASGRASQAEYFAGRWAVKEALSKALGCGIGKDCAWQEICVLNDENGKPHISLSGNTGKLAANSGHHRIHASISHEKEYVIATVILEKSGE